jgi:CHRD domain
MQKLLSIIAAKTMINTRVALIVSVVSILTLTGSAVPVKAQHSSNFIALLNSGQEVPPNSSKAFGVAFVTFNEDTQEICFSVSYTESLLTSAETAAHFHASAPPRVNAPTIIPLALGSPKNGCVTPHPPLTRQLIADLFAGLWYVNVHTMVHPGGEIRGQVLPSAF